jgi:hypothetical protein
VGIDEVARPRAGGRWARAHIPELAILAVGVLLRLSMALWYDARIGYDFNAHWPHIQYIATQHAMPPLTFNATAYHPPLYHTIGAAVVALGLDAGALGWLSALWGMLRLALIWLALEKWLPESRVARRVALALAAVLPISVHLDGMITNEALVMLLSAGVFVVAPSAIAAARAGRVKPMIGLALLLGLALMAKVSASVLVMSVAVAMLLEIVRARSAWWPALRTRARPLIAGALILAVIAGPFFVRNQILYGHPAPTGYDGLLKPNQAPYERIPYLDRRPLGFYLGWNLPIYIHPLYPTALQPEARFFPVLLATTFNDYYFFSFSGGGQYRAAQRSISGAGVTLGCISVMAGTLIALCTVIAWLSTARLLWRRRDDGEPDSRFAFLLAPLGGLIGQLHFATKYPNDNFGPIKGAYLQFIAPILCALFGVGVAWMWRRRARWRWRMPALAAMGAIVLVAAYSVHARLPGFGPDANTAAPFFAADDEGR